MHNCKVPVYNAKGEVIARVSTGMTSIGAAKILKSRSAQYSFMFKHIAGPGWIAAVAS